MFYDEIVAGLVHASLWNEPLEALQWLHSPQNPVTDHTVRVVHVVVISLKHTNIQIQ